MKAFTPRRKRKWIDRHVRRIVRALAPYGGDPRSLPPDVRKFCCDQYEQAHWPVRNRRRYHTWRLQWRGEEPKIIIHLHPAVSDLARISLGMSEADADALEWGLDTASRT